ncbi:MAG: four helix bundle protein [Polaribacter sp.]
MVSIPSNIAEGASRNSEKDFARFLGVALGSAFELETHLIIAERRKYLSVSHLE